MLKLYGDDLKEFQLKGQLLLMPQIAISMDYDTSRFTIQDLISLLQSLDHSRKLLLSEVCILGKLMLVMPTTNAASERSFSALKRVKTYLLSTTGDARLNHLMVLNVHRERTDAIDLVAAANAFVGQHGNRMQLFGRFTPRDFPREIQSLSKSTQT